MSRKFIALVIAASIAVSGVTASQVQAGDKRTRNIIAGAAALAIIGAAIAENNGSKKRARVSTQHPRPRGHGHGHNSPRHDPKYGYHDRDRRNPFAHGPRHQGPRNGVRPRPLPPRVQLGALPQRCLRDVSTRRGPIRLFAARCLNRHYNAAHRLPNECRQNVRTRNGTFHGYNPSCLRQFRRQANMNWLNRH